jgi:ribosomal protein S18 acetylase RimI-like enzyme
LTPWFFHPLHQPSVTSASDSTDSKLQIRAVAPADLTDVTQIIAESFHKPNGLWGWTYPIMRLGIYEDLKHRLASSAPHHICLVAVDTSRTIDNLMGTVELGVRFNDACAAANKSFPYLSNLAVHPSYRRQGAASGLLMGCEKLASHWGFQDIYLHVLEDNHQARQLYLKFGYRVLKVETNWNTHFFRRARQILLHKHLSVDSIG